MCSQVKLKAETTDSPPIVSSWLSYDEYLANIAGTVKAKIAEIVAITILRDAEKRRVADKCD